ncbi:trans-resveratrol di-O-methyltransferase-like [Gossypium australe]|uniref:Trans-resveratrol di-O-methyltransferase-like n=1 Tax=Gossypium australe TaxID=47621 RepID=A0A5B6W907_9ROSI|nr:trans-resveratrol di-O-methyltransferase-like [Gossypium australe]
MAPNRITLLNKEKKKNESFRQFSQRWREVPTQVQPPLLEKETTKFFVNTLKAPFINHMLGSATKSFSNIVMSGEMFGNAVRSGKIDMKENAKRLASRKKENGVNNASVYNKGYSKPVTMIDGGLIIQNSKEKPKGMRSYCEFHTEEDHEIQECTKFRALVQRLMDNKELEFFEYAKGSEGKDVCTSEEGSTEKVYKDCNMMILGEQNPISASKEGQDMGFYTHSARSYDPANTRTEPVKGKALAVEHKKEKIPRLITY